MNLKQLTNSGMSQLQRDIASMRDKTNPQIYIDRYDSRPIADVSVDSHKQFTDKYEIGEYFTEVFSESGLTLTSEIWNWLSLLYYKQLLNPYRQIGEVERLFIFPKRSHNTYPYVHLLKVPYDFYKYYRDKDRLDLISFLLRQPVNINRGIYLEIVKRPKIMKNHNFMGVIKHLFSEGDQIKRNYSDKVTRLIRLYQQYDRSFDMYRLSPRDFLKKLASDKHKEFHQYLSDGSSGASLQL